MKERTYLYYVSDFETTVFDNQTRTDVWCSGLCQLYTENVILNGCIEDWLSTVLKLKGNTCIYFHNLKFDGSFILNYLQNSDKWSLAGINEKTPDFEFLEDKNMYNYSYKYLISDMGQWYSITLKHNNRFIVIRDSLKLLPFSLDKLTKFFNTKHKKLSMKYEGFRYPNCPITDTEKQYIINDVLSLKECIEIAFSENLKKITIGACCLDEFKALYTKELFETDFPDLTEIKTPFTVDGLNISVDTYIRRSYKGGWCYVNKYKKGKVVENGCVADVNSLYPSVMHSSSGNKYPYGKPEFWQGNFIPDKIQNEHYYYFIRIKTRFYLKNGMLPCIQIKGSWLYNGTQWLETSDIYDRKTEKYYKEYRTLDGEIKQAIVTLTLTETDYKLIKKHYNLVDFEIIDGCYFYATTGIFDDYINKWSKIKIDNNDNQVKRNIAKLMLNNLYGKFSSSDNSSFKVCYLKNDGANGFYPIMEYNKKVGFIPIGSAVTSYARNFTITSAQNNYNCDGAGFVYADTDSIHCDFTPDKLKGINVHPTKFLHWKIENRFSKAYFTRQKTYIELCNYKDEKECTPYYNLRCAGMTKRCKELFLQSITGERYTKDDDLPYTDDEKEFLSVKRDITDLQKGLKVPSKLTPKNIAGGILLTKTTFEIR